jgi:hypothetical protein
MMLATTLRKSDMPHRMSKPRSESRHLRRDVDNMLRDVAFVLKHTQRIRDEILHEERKQTANV